MLTRFDRETLVIAPPPPARFTLNEWYLNNRVNYRCVDDTQQISDRILTECARIREKTAELVVLNKNETDHAIEERIKDIEFQKNETQIQRKMVLLEIEALTTYKERILDAQQSIKDDALKICKKCIISRECRVGIDLVHDDVEKELLKEIECIKGAQALLLRTIEQTNEQLRRLRSLLYFIDHDLEDKSNALILDNHNKQLNEKNLSLSIYHGTRALDIGNITNEEWKTVTDQNFTSVAKEINSAISIRSYIDTLLKQIVEDLRHQYNNVNYAFSRRIEETKEAKIKLENRHYETVRLINEMIRNITELEKAIADKEGFTACAHTRLGNRCQRSGLELCMDQVQSKLTNEVKELVDNVAHLQLMLAEAQAALRYLLKIQTQLEEEINIKTNSLKIDEVDCMTYRQSMDYHTY